MPNVTFTEFIGELPEYNLHSDLVDYLIKKTALYREIFAVPFEIIEKRYMHVERIKRSFELSPWHNAKLTSEQIDILYDFMNYFAVPIVDGDLSLSDLSGKVLDFGVGYGMSTILLSLFSDQVIASEKNLKYTKQLKHLERPGIELVLEKDCIEYMKEQISGSFSFICALGFGFWDTEQELVDSFIEQSLRLIEKKGKIMITSDYLTMDKVRKKFGVENPPYDHYRLIYHNI